MMKRRMEHCQRKGKDEHTAAIRISFDRQSFVAGIRKNQARRTVEIPALSFIINYTKTSLAN
jgi:hypothetical protein